MTGTKERHRSMAASMCVAADAGLVGRGQIMFWTVVAARAIMRPTWTPRQKSVTGMSMNEIERYKAPSPAKTSAGVMALSAKTDAGRRRRQASKVWYAGPRSVGEVAASSTSRACMTSVGSSCEERFISRSPQILPSDPRPLETHSGPPALARRGDALCCDAARSPNRPRETGAARRSTESRTAHR